MKFPSMLRILRNTQGGMGSTAKSASTPYTDEPPVARITSDQNIVSVGTPVRFDGSTSTGINLSYSWDFGDKKATPLDDEGVTASCIYNTLGKKIVTLTVTDAKKRKATASVTITVIEVVPPPTIVEPSLEVDAGNPQTVSVGDTVLFKGSVLSAPDSVELLYSWTFDDGATSKTLNGLKASCIYTTRGEKTVTLTVSYMTDGKEVAESDDVIITVIEPLMPWCTSELPAQAPAVIQLAPIPPSPPTYAVPMVHTPLPDTSPIPLQAERRLSELEKAAIDLVFKDSRSFSPTMLANTIEVKVEKKGNRADGENPRGEQLNGLIKIYRDQFRWTDAIDGGSTVGNTDIFKPGNLEYLNTFIHEAAHWWQEHQNRYRDRTPDYEFTYDMLRNVNFPCKEGHASAVATWFIIAWQLKYRPADQLINLTCDGGIPGRWHVGTVERYTEIAKIDFRSTDRNNVTLPPVGTWITRADAEQLACHFKPLIEEIQTAQPLPASD